MLQPSEFNQTQYDKNITTVTSGLSEFLGSLVVNKKYSSMLENNTPHIPVTFLEVNSVLSVGTIFVVPSDFSNANFRTNNGPIFGNSSREQVLTCPILILEDSTKICTGRVTVTILILIHILQ